MEPGSQASHPTERTSQSLAHVIGTLIALLTLIVPMVSIAHFSSTNEQAWRSPTQSFGHQN